MAEAPGLTLHVSTQGVNDASPRRLESGGGDGPLASLERARQALREARAAGHDGPCRVRLGGGVYRLREPLVLGPADGGHEGAPTIWEACPGETPVLDGGVELGGWRPVTDLPAGTPDAAHGQLWVAPAPEDTLCARLFWDEQALPRAVSVPTQDWRQWPHCQLGDDPDAQVRVPAEALPPGDDAGSAVLDFMPTPYTRWSNALSAVTGFDRGSGVLRHAGFRLPRPEKTRDIPFRLENVVSGLVEPGRWVHDRQAGRLYLWPPEGAGDPGDHRAVAPRLASLLVLDGGAKTGGAVAHLELRGLAFRHAGLAGGTADAGFGCRSSAVALRGVERCCVTGCDFDQLAGNAVSASGHVRELTIQGCTVDDVGGAGITLSGGPVGAGEPSCADNRILDNTIGHAGRLYWHSAGISLAGAARTEVAHNLIEQMPYIGISCGGGPRHTYFRGWPRPFPELEALWAAHGEGEPTIDTVKRFIGGYNQICKNVVRHVMQVLDDGAAIYCHAGHHEAVRDNVVYAVESPMGMGLYFDDEQMGSIMEGNLVYRCPERSELNSHSAAVHLHHNGRNSVVNNVLVGRRQVLSIPNGYGGHELRHNILVWEDDEPDWERADPAPVRGPGDGRRQDGWDAGPSTACRNLWWHRSGAPTAAEFLRTWRERGYGEGSLAADPQFLDEARADFTVAAASPALGLGFVQLEVHDAGPRAGS